MTQLRVAVVGAGPMGRLHARTVARSAARDHDCALAAIVDRHAVRANRLAREYGVAAVDDLRRLRDVDAAIVAVPTAAHVETALVLVEAGLDVLVEKPLANVLADAARLVERAEALGRILQVGHVEWYNPLWRAALARVGLPRSIRVQRLQPPAERGLDIDVVQDLMLHDLDWVTRALAGEVEACEASGRGRAGSGLDEAEAVLRFRSGCVARLEVSRVHGRRERTLAIEGSLGTQRVDLLGSGEEPPVLSQGALDPLGSQWRGFVEAVQSRKPPENDGRVGLAALRWVERVRAAIRAGETGEGGGHDSLVGG